MRLNQKHLALALTAGLVSLAGLAHAHGDETHKKAATAVEKEQKPWGIAGDAEAAKRSVEFKMSDKMRFTPDRLEVREGETVRFVIENQGKLLHEIRLFINGLFNGANVFLQISHGKAARHHWPISCVM